MKPHSMKQTLLWREYKRPIAIKIFAESLSLL